MDEHQRRRRIRRPRIVAAVIPTSMVLLLTACGSPGPASVEPGVGPEPAAPDTVSFVASGDSFYVVIVADTTRLFRIRDGDTSYVGRGVVTGRPAKEGAPADGRRAGAIIAIAIPEVSASDTAAPPPPEAAVEAGVPSQDTTRPVRRSALGYQYDEDLLPVPPYRDTMAFERLVVRELAGFDTTLTPETWMARHPADSLARFLPGSGDAWTRWRHWDHEGEPCARALRRIPLADREPALRVVLFYPPPPDGNLPPVRDMLGLDVERCRLGALWLLSKIEAPDSAAVPSHLHDLRTVLSARLGPPQQVGPPFLPSPRYYDLSRNRFWRDAGMSHLLTYQSYGRYIELGVWTDFADIPIEPATPALVLDRFHLPEIRRLAARAALDTTLADSLLSLASRAYLVRKGFATALPRLEAALAGVLATWLETAERLPPARRAAALLVADRALDLGLPWMDASERARAAPFEALGARYGHTLGASYVYEHNWLQDAFGMSPEAPVHDRAFLILLRRAFGTSACRHDEEAFRTVIERGERFLAERRDSPVAAEVALEVARAYGDVVAIAWEIDPVVASYVEGEPFEAEAPAARRSALAFYRMALDGLDDPALRREAWREAWRLAAGMPPVEAVHVYICD